VRAVGPLLANLRLQSVSPLWDGMHAEGPVGSHREIQAHEPASGIP